MDAAGRIAEVVRGRGDGSTGETPRATGEVERAGGNQERGAPLQAVLVEPAAQKGVLVGSCVMMLDCFRMAHDVLGLRVEESSRLCSENPARIAGVFRERGSLEVGKWADINIVSRRKGGIELDCCLVGGRVAYRYRKSKSSSEKSSLSR